MSDLSVSISKLTEHKSNEKEVFTAVNTLTAQELLRGNFGVNGATTGNGAFVTLWSATIPRNSSWSITSTVTGRGLTGGAAYGLSCGVQDFAGVATVIGGGFPAITVVGEDAAAMSAKYVLTGSLVSLQVRDDAVQAMSWRAFISCVGLV